MILSYLGFALVAWLLIGLITGIAYLLNISSEGVLYYMKQQEDYKTHVEGVVSEKEATRIFQVLLLIVAIFAGPIATLSFSSTLQKFKVQ